MKHYIKAIALLWLASLLLLFFSRSEWSLGIVFILYGVGFGLLYSVGKSKQHSAQQWENLAHRDELTGLLNRRGLKHHRIAPPYQLIIFDIDDFKYINDNYGHERGDDVLQEFAQILSTNTRDSDICCRWGGDEFIVLLKTDEQGSKLYMKRIDEHLANTDRQPRYSVSFGESSVTHNTQWQKALDNADHNLLSKK